MTTVYLEDRQGGIAVVLRDANIAPYYPPATVGAARVQIWVRSKGVGVDAAIKVADYKPGADVEFGPDSIGARDLLVAAVSVSAGGTPSVSDLNHAEWLELNYAPETGTAAGLDEHLPAVTAAPTIAKAEASDVWVVLTPMPDANAATLTDCQVRVEKADDATVFTDWTFAPAPTHRIDQTPYAAKISYRFRNQSAEELAPGNGRGWSAWSPKANAAEIGAAVPPPPAAGPGGALETFEPDPGDTRAGIQREILAV